MARGPTPSPNALKAERARLARRLKSMSKHRRALDAAVTEFGTDLDPSVWEVAFNSTDPTETNRVLAVIGGYSTLINNYVEMLKAGARLTGIVSGRRPNTETCVEAVHADGGLFPSSLRRRLLGSHGTGSS